jgi:hypothetical protein
LPSASGRLKEGALSPGARRAVSVKELPFCSPAGGDLSRLI